MLKFFVIKGDFVVDKLIVEQDVPDEDFEFILLVFVGEFVDDAENLVDLVNDTDPLGVLELLIDLVFVPEEDDEAQPGGDLDLLNDLGVSEMELLTILDDSELYPDEQLEAIASRLGFGEQFNQVIENN